VTEPGISQPPETPPSPLTRARLALRVSAVVIVLGWAASVVLNLYGLDQIEGLSISLPLLAKTAGLYGLITIGAVTLMLFWSGERLSDLGMRGPDVGSQIAGGAWLGVVIFAANGFMISPLLDALLPADAPKGIDLGSLFTDLRDLPIWIALVVLKGGFSEELWRIFGLTRFEKLFGRAGLAVALAAGSVVFGIEHLYQGVGGAIATGLVGLGFGFVYLRRRSALEAMAAHATFDIVGVTLGYIIYHRSGTPL